MNAKATRRSGFFNLRVLVNLPVILGGIFVALLGIGTFSKACAQTCDTYITTTGTGTITPGDTDTGNHCDDCYSSILLPFLVSVYGQTFATANATSNGALELIGNSAPYTHGCVTLPGAWNMAILAFQGDLRTDQQAGCAAFLGGNCGIFTSVTGTAPNRQFNIEWRVVDYADTTAPANFEVVFYENYQSFFDIFYGATSDNGSDETSGVQASVIGPATTFSCGAGTLTSFLRVSYTCSAATATPSPTATATATFTSTPTATATFTPTPTATATFTPTPTPTATQTPTPTPTATATATATATLTPTPTPAATPRQHPTPPPHPSPPPHPTPRP